MSHTAEPEFMDRVLQGAQLSQDPLAQEVAKYVRDQEGELGLVDGVLYYDFPIFKDPEDRLYRSYLLLLSRSHGVVLLNATSADDRNIDLDAIQQKDDELLQLHSIIYGMLLKSRRLRTGLRAIKPNVAGVLFLPNVEHKERIEALALVSAGVCSYEALSQEIKANLQPQQLDDAEWAELRAIVEGAKGLMRPKDRSVPDGRPNSMAGILAELENEIANFDLDQRRAAMSIVDGPQRIRGLAGSGKTIILAYKAAQLHLRNPDADILVTFYTKSLYEFVRQLITRFYRQYVDYDPNWERVHVRHAWGGRNIEGVYFAACLASNITPMNFTDARKGGGSKPFAFACKKLLATGRVRPQYDYVLIDEAQDSPPSFYRLCFELTRGGPIDRNVVWAYDELQNIFDIQIQSPREVFGTNPEGRPLVDLERASEKTGGLGIHDIVLHRCYRNPREVLITAHALGFGVYSDTIVQMLQDEEHWRDVGYEVVEGTCTPGTSVVIERPRENSPLTISDRVQRDELVSVRVCESMGAETTWIAREVVACVEDGLRPEDIMVICLDDRAARRYFELIAEQLQDAEIDVNNVLDSPYGEKVFIREGAVTLSTVYRAKGNEAAVIFAAGIDAVFPLRKSRMGRNKIFTAFTRAKAWLRVSGAGPGAEYFATEIGMAMGNVPQLRFEYPDPEEVDTLQRDWSDKFVELERVIRRLEQMDLMEEAKEILRRRGGENA